MNEQLLSNRDDLAKLILRFAVGFLMIFHGVAKVSHGVGFIEGQFESMGLPAFLAYGVYVGEIIAPFMLLAGFRVRIASLLIIATMIVAIFMAHSGDIFALNKYGAWAIELPMFYIFTSLAIFFLGAGKYSLDKK